MLTISRTTATTIAGYFHIVVNIGGIPFAIRLYRKDRYIPLVICFMVVIACCAGILLGILMIIGIFKKSHKLMAPFVYFVVFGMIGSGIVLIIYFTGHILNKTSMDFMHTEILFWLFMEGLQFTLWFFVYSLYMEYKEKANTTQNTQPQADGPLLGTI